MKRKFHAKERKNEKKVEKLSLEEKQALAQLWYVVWKHAGYPSFAPELLRFWNQQMPKVRPSFAKIITSTYDEIKVVTEEMVPRFVNPREFKYAGDIIRRQQRDPASCFLVSASGEQFDHSDIVHEHRVFSIWPNRILNKFRVCFLGAHVLVIPWEYEKGTYADALEYLEIKIIQPPPDARDLPVVRVNPVLENSVGADRTLCRPKQLPNNQFISNEWSEIDDKNALRPEPKCEGMLVSRVYPKTGRHDVMLSDFLLLTEGEADVKSRTVVTRKVGRWINQEAYDNTPLGSAVFIEHQDAGVVSLHRVVLNRVHEGMTFRQLIDMCSSEWKISDAQAKLIQLYPKVDKMWANPKAFEPSMHIATEMDRFRDTTFCIEARGGWKQCVNVSIRPKSPLVCGCWKLSSAKCACALLVPPTPFFITNGTESYFSIVEAMQKLHHTWLLPRDMPVYAETNSTGQNLVGDKTMKQQHWAALNWLYSPEAKIPFWKKKPPSWNPAEKFEFLTPIELEPSRCHHCLMEQQRICETLLPPSFGCVSVCQNLVLDYLVHECKSCRW